MRTQDYQAKIDELLSTVLPEMIGLRRKLHQQPERTWHEEQTAETIATELESIEGIQVQRRVGRLGVVGNLKGDLEGPVIALRADMDALPIHEQSELPYKSRHEGCMHACGHDGHMANLMAAAHVLSQMKSELKGTVKFIFQPAEEGGAGAKAMCDDGVLENPKVDMIFGLHGWPEEQAGRIAFKSGPLMAANSQFKIRIRGVGCHAAMPHLGTDQVLVAARIIESLQSISSRVLAPVEPVALTVAKMEAGRACNIIPDTVVIEGTLRTVSEEGFQKAKASMSRIVEGVAHAHNVEGSCEFIPVYPATVNHHIACDYLEKLAVDLMGREQVNILTAPSMGAEDFSFYLQRVPGAFFFLGLNEGAAGEYPSLHHPKFDFNDQVLEHGARLFVQLALNFHKWV